MDIQYKKIVVVMPAYNAELTLEKTFREIPKECTDEIILVDDGSFDNTINIAKKLGIKLFIHSSNIGYGANQKTCYTEALNSGADIVVMIHPDYQYDPRIIPSAIEFIKLDICDVILGSRIRTRREALSSGMPLYKYIANRFLTLVENIVLGQNISDFHTGFRIYTKNFLNCINFLDNSNDFAFDSDILVQAVYHGFRIGEVPIPVRYFPEASSINFRRSIIYGFQTLYVLLKFLMQTFKLMNFKMFLSK